jgi:hypothetical protein
MNGLFALLLAISIVGLASVLIIWVVGKLHLGLELDFGSAIITGLLIAFVGGALTFALSIAGVQLGEGLIAGMIHLLVTLITLLVGARFLPGVRVTRYTGVIVAATAIGAFYWLGGQVLGMLVL